MNEKILFVDTSKECIDLLRKYAKEGLKSSGKIMTKILKNDINFILPKTNLFKFLNF